MKRVHALAAGMVLTGTILPGSLVADGHLDPTFKTPRKVFNNMRMELEGEANRIYQIDASEDLISWESLLKVHTATGSATYDKIRFQDSPRFFVRATEFPEYTVQTLTYHGWDDAVLMGNGQVEVIVVPSIGRVLQFRRTGQADGPFWINPSTEGQSPSTSGGYQNFGGDKVWPSDQHWGWPPPAGFDRVSYSLANNKVTLRLTGPVHAPSGIRVTREIIVDHFEPKMMITSTFTREQAASNTAFNDPGIWVVTQLNDPVRLFMPESKSAGFPDGYKSLGTFTPPNAPYISVANNLISMTRNTAQAHKIGNDSDRLLWVGTDEVLLMHSPRNPGIYKDQDCSAEIYTANNNPYIELELLTQNESPAVGESFSQTVTYTLLPRTEATPEAEVAKLFDF